MDKYAEITGLADRRGIFFPSAEIHSPLAGFWDFGPLGATLRRRVVDLWRREVVRRTDAMEMEGCVILPKQAFEASGHLTSFADPIVQCPKCSRTFRADKLIEEKTKKETPEGLSTKEFDELIKKNNIHCPDCKSPLGKTTKFNMMMGLSVGPASEGFNAYLRPETCQSIFTAFQKLYKTSRVSLPLGIAQLGRSFRNEISPRQSLIRLREITQLELEVFFNPKRIDEVEEWESVKSYPLRLKLLGHEETKSITCEDAVKKKMVSGRLVAYYLAVCQQFFEKCGFSPENMRNRELEEKAKAFYSKETWDFEVRTSLGWVELVANNYRTDYDLASHSKVSGADLSVVEGEEKFIPHVWEMSAGLDRIMYTVMENSLSERDGKPLLKFPTGLSPLDIVILPLVKKDGLDKKATEVHNLLKKHFETKYDEKQSIGKRYVVYDQLGVPLAVTIDYDSIRHDDATLRDRDSQKQVRVKVNELKNKIDGFFSGEKIF